MTFAITLIEIYRVFQGSDGAATTLLYERLESHHGSIGLIAVNLFRAQKGSSRAKVYRGGDGRGSFRGKAYDRKQWAMDNLCRLLESHSELAGIARWGWGEDPQQRFHRHVLYIDLPTGQVSFHTESRGPGPAYPGQWDGARDVAADRILRWTAALLDPPPAPADAEAEAGS